MNTEEKNKEYNCEGDLCETLLDENCACTPEVVTLQTNETMLLIAQKAENNKQVIQLLCERAKAQGFITDEFIEKILARETEFPTGLPTAVPVAIPHIHDGCLKSFFSIAVLDHPVAFESMDGAEEPIMTEIVFLFGITDPSQQCAVLMKFCELFQDGAWMNGCKAVSTKDKLIDHLKAGLGEYLSIS